MSFIVFLTSGFLHLNGWLIRILKYAIIDLVHISHSTFWFKMVCHSYLRNKSCRFRTRECAVVVYGCMNIWKNYSFLVFNASTPVGNSQH